MRQVLLLLFSILCLSCMGAEPSAQLFPLQVGELVGYIDADGRLAIKPQFLSGDNFSEGFAVVEDRQLGLGFLGVDGHFSQIKNARILKNFQEGRAVVQLNNGMFGYLGRNLKFAIEPRFSDASDFSDGLASVEISGLNKTPSYTFINKDGVEVFKKRYDTAFTFSSQLAVVKTDGKYGLVDVRGIEVVKPRFASIMMPFGGPIAFSVRQGPAERWGFLDRIGNIVIEPQYSAVGSSFRDGFAAVRIGKTWGLIDDQGRFVIKPQFEGLTAPSGSIVRFKEDQRWGYMYTDGRILHRAEFDGALEFINGLARISKFATVNGVNQEQDGYLKSDGTLIWGQDLAGDSPQ